jgi:hypothetical protein
LFVNRAGLPIATMGTKKKGKSLGRDVALADEIDAQDGPEMKALPSIIRAIKPCPRLVR